MFIERSTDSRWAIDRFLMGILVVPLKTDLHLSDTKLGLLQGFAFALLYCVAGLPLGRLADVGTRRLMLFFGCVAWTIATAACAFAGSFDVLFVTRIVVGLGEATLMPAAISLIGAYIARERLGLANGIFMMGASTGKAAAFIVGGALLSVLIARGGITLSGLDFKPWQALFLCAAAPGIVSAIAVLTIREPARAVRDPARGTLREVFRHVGRFRKTFLSFGGLGICSILIAHIFAAWAPSFLVRHYGMSVGKAAMIVGLIVLAVAPLGGIAAGILTDALTRRGTKAAPVLVIAGAVALAVPFTALFTLTDNLALSVVGFALAQMVGVAGGPQAYAGIQLLTPAEHRGLSSAFYLTVSTLLALGVGPALIGWCSDTLFTSATDGLGQSMLAVCALFAGLGLLLAMLARADFDSTVAAANA